MIENKYESNVSRCSSLHNELRAFSLNSNHNNSNNNLSKIDSLIIPKDGSVNSVNSLISYISSNEKRKSQNQDETFN